MALKLLGRGVIKQEKPDEFLEIFNQLKRDHSTQNLTEELLQKERLLSKKKERQAKKTYRELMLSDEENETTLEKANREIASLREEIGSINYRLKEVQKERSNLWDKINDLLHIYIENNRIKCHIGFDTPEQYLQFREQQNREPQPIRNPFHTYHYCVYENNNTITDQCNKFIFRGYLYGFDEKDIHTINERKLLVKEHYFKQEKKFNRLQKEIRLFEKLEASEVQERELIPEEVRFTVWRRDEGKCVQCGSKKNLEFDHIIPISKGGSSTERNIQLLCAKCNREKSDKI